MTNTNQTWNNSPISRALDQTGELEFFRAQLPQGGLAVANHRLYLDSGQFHTKDKTTNGPLGVYPEHWLVWLQLDAPLAWSNYQVYSHPKPSYIPLQIAGVSFSRGESDTKFLVFGGQPNASFWLYNTESTDWRSQGLGVSNMSGGAATVDPNQGVGYYLGGQVDGKEMNELLSCDLSNWGVQKTTLPSNFGTHAFLEYMPVGEKGILVLFGGQSSTSTLSDMSQIYIYDIAGRSWGSQYAQGMNGTPISRYSGCSVMKMAPDNTSYNIYIQGGLSNNDQSMLDDIWVLSIPSFTWINIATAVGTPRQFGQTCYSFGRHMFSTGGDSGAFATPLFYIFDLVRLSWTNSYDPQSEPYTIPEEIYTIIGGSSSGKATKKEPSGGWSSKQLGNIFTTTTRTSSSPNSPTSSTN
ncbi:hypothetical protein BDD12DRAFT_983647, partial [Trichophaea hybrida]